MTRLVDVFLAETFDSKFDTHVENDLSVDSEKYTFCAYVGGVMYNCTFYKVKQGFYEIEFRPSSGGYGITRSGNSFGVFSWVVSAIKKFITEKPEVIKLIFSAVEPSRQKLYDRMIKNIASGIGWKLTFSQVSQDAELGKKYVLEKS